MHCISKPTPEGVLAGVILTVGLLSGSVGTRGADLAEGERLLQHGDYAGCIRQAQAAIRASEWDETWPLLLAKAQLAVGQYAEAQTTVTNALRRFDNNVPLLLVAYDVLTANGQTNRARDVLDSLSELAGTRARYVRDAPGLVALGKAALLLGADPKLVLENFLDQAKRVDANNRDAWLASGDLALDKSDYQLAAQTFTEALKKFPRDPDVEFGLARAYAPSNAAQMGKALEAVLEANPNHVPALLLLADHLVDAEQYADAGQMLDRALRVNPWSPEVWAYRAVLAELRNDTNAEANARGAALKFWGANPRVDQLIGRKLSQKYRFAEGAAHQRQALRLGPDYLPAKLQLAQDLLRLGNEAAGWQLAEEVHERDGYDVTAFNLVTLRQTMAKFQTLTNADFVLRMSPGEAGLYGDRALALLERAKKTLSAKYGLRLERPTVVEIFPDQKDFAVRTFGMPLNPGFLGVCFGHVVTANSPAADPGHPANWEAVLWHEFCHVITLNLTRNRMPRWLSEGISVYEERQADPTWGQAMNRRYRQMVLGGELTPVGRLSAAFLTPKSNLDVQFAYFESSLVVEYLVRTFGFESLKGILVDLGQGIEINDAIARHTAPMTKVEKDFAAFARDRANDLAPGLDWKKPADLLVQGDDAERATSGKQGAAPPISRGLGLPAVPGQGASESAADSTNYWVLTWQATALIRAEKWAEAKAPLERLIELYPGQTGGDCAYVMLARVCRELKEPDPERAALAKLAALDDTAADAYLRLMELDEAARDWAGVVENAERFLAVNPLLPQPYHYLAQASEELGHPDAAIRAYERLLLLDPSDLAEVHFRLARQLRQQGDGLGAKRHALEALEEAPRFRAAQRLLLAIEQTWPPPSAPATR
ncbi:MAG: tetratricopeptide repeat protein [Verrucomicrobia bacterium]|nr:tetratricopeptide repeat protein [Verrucomicrobiota bacterium]